MLYTGVTNNLTRRVTDHFLLRGDTRSFAGRYSCFNLVFYEKYENIKAAIAREKEIKNRPRKWKEELISEHNKCWNFLNSELFDNWPPE